MHENPKLKSRHGSAGFTPIELLIVVAMIGILAAIGVQAALYAFDVARLGSTVGNIRGVATVVMAYETANSTLPAAGLQTVADVEPTLRPMGAPVPTTDGWGNDLYYETVMIAGDPTFRVWSYGKDGIPDGAAPGVWVDFFSDVVLESGTFIQTRW
jgi:prepilin-type N-terminal cleavage/methylation domain-containing protein